MLQEIALLALFAAFLIHLSSKWGLREKGQIYAPRLISEALSCDFCISFWVCLLLSAILYIFVSKDLTVLFYPVFATPITRLLL